MISPLNMLQEQQIGRPHAPWRVIVCCQLLNMTHGRQVRPMIDRFFALCPSPKELIDCLQDQQAEIELATMLKPLGFRDRRTFNLEQMSLAYDGMVSVRGEDFWRATEFREHRTCPAHWARGLRGCGQYVVDSLNIFIYDRTDMVSVTDTWLKDYLNWRRSQ